MKRDIDFKIDDAGVFISLTTVPFGDEETFIPSVKDVITEYKDRTREANKKLGHVTNDSFFEEYCYNPIGYCLWGSFDLALISLVDDFSLSSRNFHPYTNLISKHEQTDKEGINGLKDSSNNFSYQVMTTVHNYPTENSNPLAGINNVATVWDKIVKSEIEANKLVTKSIHDFIGISSFKINNGLLLGTGTDTIDLIKLKLGQIINETFGEEGSFLILDSFSWYEVVILFFSDDIDKIAKALSQCREMTIKSVIEYGDNNDMSINGKNWDIIKDDITQHSFLSNYGYPKNKEEIGNSHVFVKTFSHFGFNVDLLEQEEISPKKRQLRLLPRYDIKPGHYAEAMTLLNSKSTSNGVLTTEFNYLLGENDAFLNTVNDPNSRGFTFEEYHSHFRRNLLENQSSSFTRHIRRVKTLPYFRQFIIEPSDFDPDKHTESYLHIFSYKQADIDYVKEYLYKLHVSKVVRERILRMYVNFNSGIQDPIMYIYFIDLRPLLDKLQFMLKLHSESFNLELDIALLHTFLLDIAQIFEQAYSNRFHQSHTVNEISDFNLDFNGGIQQIVSAMDTLYKFVFVGVNNPTIRTALDNKIDKYSFHYTYPCVFVAAQPGVQSNDYCLRLNYFHVFEPAIFMAEIVKEASNCIFLRKDNNMIDQVPEFAALFQTIDIDIAKSLEGSEHWIYLPYITAKEEKMLNYWVVDVIVYYVSYHHNPKLFRFWFWHIALQTSSSYNLDGNINEKVFVRLLLRYLMVMKYCGNLPKEDPIAPNVNLQNLWNRHYTPILNLVEKLFSTPAVNTLYTEFIPVTLSPIVNRIRYSTPDFNGRDLTAEDKQEITSFFHKFDERESINISATCTKSLEYWNNYSHFVRYIIKEGGHFKIENGSKKYDFEEKLFFLVTSFNAHLMRVMEAVQKNEENKNSINFQNSVLARNCNGNPLEYISDLKDSNTIPQVLKFDELGGFFAAGYEEKRELFKNRVSVLKMMIDFSLKNKIHLINTPALSTVEGIEQ